jgi:hypothetical protein
MKNIKAAGGGFIAAVAVLIAAVGLYAALVSSLANSGLESSGGLMLPLSILGFVVKFLLPIWAGYKAYKYIAGRKHQ